MLEDGQRNKVVCNCNERKFSDKFYLLDVTICSKHQLEAFGIDLSSFTRPLSCIGINLRTKMVIVISLAATERQPDLSPSH